jgi:hypothetical protein
VLLHSLQIVLKCNPLWDMVVLFRTSPAAARLLPKRCCITLSRTLPQFFGGTWSFVSAAGSRHMAQNPSDGPEVANRFNMSFEYFAKLAPGICFPLSLSDA